MSANALIEMLKKVGYPNADKLDPNSLDWAFEDQTMLPFMQWLCSIGKDNILSHHEIQDYKTLMKEGKVLTGASLEEALKISTRSAHNDDPDCGDEDESDKLQSKVDRLKQEVEEAKEKKTMLIEKKKHLDSKHTALRNKTSGVEYMASKAKKNYEHALEACHSHSLQVDEVLEKVAKAVSDLTHLYADNFITDGRGVAGHTAADVKFLSQIDLSRYHQTEEKFSQELTAFTKKRFFEGMADITGERDTAHYSMLDVSNPENLSSSGLDLGDDFEEEGSFREDCQEFSLLQQVFPQSELNRINALVNTRKAMNAVKEAKGILNLLKTEKFPTSEVTICRLQSKVEEGVQQAQSEASQYEHTIPDLVKRLGALQGTEILTGNYDLKLKRQDYFTKNQDQVIDYLISQGSRSELLLMLYDLELKFHQRTHLLLSAVGKRLKVQEAAWTQRMKCLDDPDLAGSRSERRMIDVRDTSSHVMYRTMAKASANTTTEDICLPVDKLKARAERLYSEFESEEAGNHTKDQYLIDNTTLLESTMSLCHSSLYDGATTTAGLPNLTPGSVQAAMGNIQGQINTLMSKVDGVFSDIEKKKKLLKTNTTLAKEREVSTLFHTDPKRLVEMVYGQKKLAKVMKTH